MELQYPARWNGKKKTICRHSNPRFLFFFRHVLMYIIRNLENTVVQRAVRERRDDGRRGRNAANWTRSSMFPSSRDSSHPDLASGSRGRCRTTTRNPYLVCLVLRLMKPKRKQISQSSTFYRLYIYMYIYVYIYTYR